MEDKILKVKKEMKKVLRTNGLTRSDKHNLAKQKAMILDESELSILKKECYRDYEVYDRMGDIKELFTLFFTGIGLIIAVLSTLFKDNLLIYIDTFGIFQLVLVYVMLGIGGLAATQMRRSNKMHITKHLIDILEEIKP